MSYMTSLVLGLVLDTDVLVAALDRLDRRIAPVGRRGARRPRQLAHVNEPYVRYEAVLTRPTVLHMIGIDAAAVLAMLDELAGLCVPVALDYRWRPAATDPDDDMVIETAVNGDADVIATFNIDDLRAGAARFGIAAERPAAVLRRLRP